MAKTVPHTPRPARRQSAFTLVELLVVIGIIALLISILLPSLNKAREAARRIKCASQLRSVGQFMTIYANDNKDKILIGHEYGTWFFNYGIMEASGGSYVNPDIPPSIPDRSKSMIALGYLVGFENQKRPLRNQGQTLYCPTQTLHQYNDATVGVCYWPPEKNATACRIGYSTRPYGKDVSTKEPYDENYDYSWLIDGTNGSKTWNMMVLSSNGGNNPGTVRHPNWPTRSFMKSRAIVMDLFNGDPNTIWNTGHRDGVNVLYNDGSVRWQACGKKYNMTMADLQPDYSQNKLNVMLGAFYQNGWSGQFLATPQNKVQTQVMADMWSWFDRN